MLLSETAFSTLLLLIESCAMLTRLVVSVSTPIEIVADEKRVSRTKPVNPWMSLNETTQVSWL
jgi:hypothetical protein